MSRIRDGSVYSLFRSLKRERTPPSGEWRTLTSKPEKTAEETGGFRESMVEGLPEAARRWLLHSIHPGTILALKAELDLVGDLRPDLVHGWYGMHIRQTVSPPLRSRAEGSARQGLRRLRVEEDFALGAARRQFLLLGLIPIIDQQGLEFSRSAQELLVLQSVWVPAALLPQRGVAWTEIDAQHAGAAVAVSGRKVELVVTVAEDGSLREASVLRWGNPRDQGWEAFPFRLQVLEETPFGGYTIPSVISAGWVLDSEKQQESMRWRVDSVHYS